MNAVRLDGKMTQSDEWSDTPENHLSLPCAASCALSDVKTVDFVVWAKHDATWLYILYRVDWPTSRGLENDGTYLRYCWGRLGGHPWQFCDATLVKPAQFGATGDFWTAYAIRDDQFDDTELGGQNNVQGTMTHDGAHYWFEFRKPLDSGDGHDWILAVGETYGIEGVDGRMTVEFRRPVGNDYVTWKKQITLTLDRATMTTIVATTSGTVANVTTITVASVTTMSSQQSLATQTTTEEALLAQVPFGSFGLLGILALVGIVSALFMFTRRRKPPAAALKLEEAREQSVVIKPTTIPSKPVVSTGYLDLDVTLDGGIPEGYAVVLVSPSYDERDLLLRKIIDSALSSGRPAFYISNDIERTQDLLARYQRSFYAFSPQADKIASDAANLYKIPGIENLSEANISLALAIKDARAKERATKMVLIIDILSDLLLRYKATTTRRWLSDFVGKRKAEGFTTLTTLNPLTGTKEDSQTVIDFFDGVIEIFEKELKERSRRFVIVKKMYGKKYSEYELMLDKDKLF